MKKFLQNHTEHLIGTFGQGGALEPGIAITTGKQLYYGFREKLTGTGSKL